MTEEKWNCRNCAIEIGGHNQYCHDGMCDDCFFDAYFPEEAQIIETDPEKMKSHCRSSPIRKENEKFKEFLEHTDIDQERLGKIVKEIESKITCAHGGDCCKFLETALQKENLNALFVNAEFCPIVFNVLENAKEEFLEEIYAFENL